MGENGDVDAESFRAHPLLRTHVNMFIECKCWQRICESVHVISNTCDSNFLILEPNRSQFASCSWKGKIPGVACCV